MQSGRGVPVGRAPVTQDEQEDHHQQKQLSVGTISKDAELAETSSKLSSSDGSRSHAHPKLDSLSSGSGDGSMLLPSIGEDMEYDDGEEGDA